MPFRDTIGEIAEIRRDELSVEWSINSILSLMGKVGDWYESRRFDLSDESRWVFKIFPDGMTRDSSGWVDICLERFSGPPNETLYITLGIKTAKGVKNEKKRGQKFSYGDHDCLWLKFCSRYMLNQYKSSVMPGDKLTITCHMKRGPTIDACTQTEKEFIETEDPAQENRSSRGQGIEKATGDIGKLLTSGENSDVTVQVGGVDFKAHRLILCARCPALSGVLEQEDTAEGSSRISISDCDPDVFKEFLHFLYTGSVQFLSEKHAFCLYQIAVRYSADDLKRQCLDHIRNTLCVKTFCNTVHLALTHEERGLLKLAFAFAFRNIQSILLSPEWQNFVHEYPAEANEIFIKSSFPTRIIYPTKSKFNKKGPLLIILTCIFFGLLSYVFMKFFF